MRSLSILLEEAKIVPDTAFKRRLQKAVEYLDTKGKILLVTTSNRSKHSSKDGQDRPKSTRIAEVIQRSLGAHKCTLVDIPKLKIYNCEGNVSSKDGNTCGVRGSKIQDEKKNPSGHLRCWASYNNEDDELWKVVTPLLESHVVVFLGSVRWGQANAYYQKLIERLDWLENRHTTLGESNIIKDIESGFIFIGQNWNMEEVVKTQKQVHEFYGFKIVPELYFGWQFTTDIDDESKQSYKEAVNALDNIIDIRTLL
jgi:hypothetical protein